MMIVKTWIKMFTRPFNKLRFVSANQDFSKLKYLTNRRTHQCFCHKKITINRQKSTFMPQTKHRTQDHAEKISGYNKFTYRTHTCGELRQEHVGLKVTLCGWVQYSRLSKFIVLRDSYGTTQCIFAKENSISIDLPLETVIKVEGEVCMRPENMINPNMATGEIEVSIEKLELLNPVTGSLPFNLRDYQKAKESLRLKHRYIDLRFSEMQNNLRQRSILCHNFRRHLIEKLGFVEVETPTLFCETPGGAREFVVPTHFPGLFYSLVQSPQQFKQMLMSGGLDRYFQIARCYRDETTRPDRQPEFTQLDIELSFCNIDDVLVLVEDLLHRCFLKPLPSPPFFRMTYREALETYGTDKPDLTYDMRFINITQLMDNKDAEFGAYMLPYSELLELTSKHKDKMKELGKRYNVEIVLNQHVQKRLGLDLYNQIIAIERKPIILSMGNNDETCLCLGEIRELIASELKSHGLLPIRDDLSPVWITDFPLFIRNADNLETCHHPFTAPHPEDLELLDSQPTKVRSLAYDLVINGNEIGGGSVRIHNMHLQEKIFKMLNIDLNNMQHFLNTLRYGCPPHAGIALGLDRLVALACNASAIRDVIAFPKSNEGKDLMSEAPSVVSDDTLKYYHIKSV